MPNITTQLLGWVCGGLLAALLALYGYDFFLVGNLRNDIAKLQKNQGICEANTVTLKSAIKQQNDALAAIVAADKAREAKAASDIAAAEARKKKELKSHIASPSEFNAWLIKEFPQ